MNEEICKIFKNHRLSDNWDKQLAHLRKVNTQPPNKHLKEPNSSNKQNILQNIFWQWRVWSIIKCLKDNYKEQWLQPQTTVGLSKNDNQEKFADKNRPPTREMPRYKFNYMYIQYLEVNCSVRLTSYFWNIPVNCSLIISEL